jgi:peptide/nickel transport system substrate-binding protein
MRSTNRSTLWRLLAVLLAFVLIAAACGGDSDDDSAGDDTATTDETDGGDGDDTAEDEDDMAEEDATDDSADDTEAPEVATDGVQRGGNLTYLLEAESDTWEIPGANCAVSCITVMRAVMDPLTVVNLEGDVEPYLLESIESNDDFTSFTLTMREGITFHDGTPADGAAVLRNLQEMAAGLLQGQVLVDLTRDADGAVTGLTLVDDMTVQVDFTVPFATFPFNIAERTGWLFAPSYWDDPERAGAMAVGTGPFMMTEWTRGEQTVVEANPNYWKTDAEGEALPYLDSITFRPVPDVSARRATMEAGDANGNMDSFGENKAFWNEDWVADGGQLLVPSPARETTYLLLNNATPTMADPEFRTALAHCTNREEYLQFRAPGNALADGPFAEGALGYLEDPGFPQFDPDLGNEILDRIGRPEVLTYGTTNVPSNLLTAELFVQQWSTNCGLNVEIDQFDQSELITKAITGDFELFLWRNHGQGNPGLEYVWWHSRHAEGLALNFGRIVDENLDALMQQTWATTDRTELDTVAQDINRLFAENVYNIWLNTTEWANPFSADVRNFGVLTLPSGGFAQTGIAGRTWLAEAWLAS